ncbi:MAG: hypothetical protein JW785_09740 [Acidimicrobiia bacterium]|nr:hypothetical protein [Acidimicrobiia bacterium]
MTLPVHGLVRYLRADLGAGDGRLRWKVPRAILGIIPAGARRVEVPVAEVESTRLGRAVRPVSFLAGLAGIALPFFFLPWWAALPILLVGLWVVLVSLGPRLEVRTRAGKRHRVNVCFSHQLDADLYVAAVAGLVEQAQEAA